jgi:amino acid permease
MYSDVFNFSSGILFILVFIYSFLLLRKIKVFKKDLSIKLFYWYLIFIFTIYAFIIFYVISLLQGYSFGFYSDDFSIPMFINYFLGIISNIVILIYTIHLEYDISKIQKYNLRDKYSHDLGNIIQVISSAAILTNVDEDLNNQKTENLEIIQKKCEEAAKLIKDIKKIQ